MENLKFYVDQNAPKTKFDHYWEKCVGACHAYTALREDYRMMLRKAKKDLGFQYVRDVYKRQPFDGWRRIRTFESVANRFTVCPLWPLGNPSLNRNLLYMKYLNNASTFL